MNKRQAGSWRNPITLLFLMALAVPFSLGAWMALINNFVVERAGFNGADIGLLQSLREVPGFLSFGVVFVLLLMREQTLVLVSLILLGIGTCLAGFLPTFPGLVLTTMVMSVGFHYFETVNQSLQMQWLKKDQAAAVLGRLISVGALASVSCYGLIYLALNVFGLAMEWVFFLGGGITIGVAVFAWLTFPHYPAVVEQNKRLVFRRRYWLYYALTFMAGARRQIFVVFAGFLMVEKFKFDASAIALMFLINMLSNIAMAPRIGRLIGRWGERRALAVEYLGLIVVFTGYALVDNAWLAVGLYVVDHLFFAMAIAMKTYFQKIADPADLAPSAGVAFSINHIAAVVIPTLFGMLWLVSPSAVFACGAAMAALSLGLSRFIPKNSYPRQ